MKISQSCVARTSVFLAVSIVLQGCGEGSPELDAASAAVTELPNAESPVSLTAAVSVNTGDFDLISVPIGAALPVIESNGESDSAIDVAPIIVVGADTSNSNEAASPAIQPVAKPPEATSADELEVPLAATEPVEEPEPLTEPVEEPEPLVVVEPEIEPEAPPVAEPVAAPTALAVEALVVVPDESNTEQSVVENEAPSTQTDSNESTATPSSTAIDTRNIIVGNGSGDAVCLHLGNEEKGFGGVTDSDWGRWLSQFRFSIGEEFLAVERRDDGSNALRHRFIPSPVGTDRAVVGSRLSEHRTYRLTQSFYFEPGWDWGGRFEGGKLGFGFGGGTAPMGGTIDPNGFSSRLMWRGNGDGTGRMVIYSYSADRPGKYGEDIRYGDLDVPIGEWFTVVMEVTANSSTAVSDGSMRGWIDGQLVLERDNVGWQLAGDTPMVDALFYSTFYGGNSTEWSPSTTTYVKTRDVCWAPVVDGYSGIDPDQGRLVVASTENPEGSFADDPTGNIVENNWREQHQRFVSLLEESLVNIRTVAPVASLTTQRYYDEAIAELTASVITTDEVTGSSLSLNPIPGLHNSVDQLNFALTDNANNEIQKAAITEVLTALQVAATRSAELAIAVVENTMNIHSCSGDQLSIACSEANEILLELYSHFENIDDDSNSESDSFFITETIWNRSVDALNALN